MRLSLRITAFLLLIAFSSLSLAVTQFSESDYTLYPGDFNGDGKTDLLYIGKTPDKPNGIALADGGGSPQVGLQSWPATYLGIQWSTGQYIPVVGDFNGDGRSDVLMQSATPGVSYVLLANTNGALGAVGQLIGVSQRIGQTDFGVAWSADQHKLLVGDFDGDGKDDVLLQAATKGGTNAIVLAASDGTLFTRSVGNCWSSGPQQCWTDGEQGLDWSTKSAVLTVGKFNADARADILYQPVPKITLVDYDVSIPVPVFKPNTFGVFLSQYPGANGKIIQTANQLWSKSDLGAAWSPLVEEALTADFNGDGYGDVLLQFKGGGNKLLYGNSAGRLGTAVAPGSGAAGFGSLDYRIVVGKFGASLGPVLYLQAKTSSGDNRFTSDISAATVSTYGSTMQIRATMPTVPTAIGATPATADVTQNGSAAYTIPIQLPRGTAGLTPELSLTYSSGAGNGLVGVGWNLSGLGVITRCPQTLAQDGVTLGVQLLASDQYCLNGNRMRLVSGTQGASGSTYRTELETYALITANGNGTQGPLSFTVKTKDGLIYEYGGTADSRIGVPGNTGVTRVWALSKVSDRALSATAGNYWTVAYVNDAAGTGAYRPDYIDYTTNSLASPAAAPYRVTFTYEDRNSGENVVSYYGGGRIKQTVRLKSIELRTSAGAGLIRSYTLGYEVPSSSLNVVSRLGTVWECSASGACMANTAFTWSDAQTSGGAPELGAAVPEYGYASATQGEDFPPWSHTVKSFTLDINGDGIPDAFQWIHDENGYPAVPSDGFGLFIGTNAGPFAYGIGGTFPQSPTEAPFGVYDIDEDGKEDVLFKSVYVHQRGDGSYWVDPIPAAAFPGVADVNGDGYADFIALGQPDVNDGVQSLDIRFHRTDGVFGFESSPSGSWVAPANDPIMSSVLAIGGAQGRRERQSVAYADVDGDGRQDMLVMLKSGWRVLYSNGTGFTAGEMIPSAPSNAASPGNPVTSYFPPVPIDINGDGCTDFAYAKYVGSEYKWYLAISKCRAGTSSLTTDVATGIPVTGLLWAPGFDNWGSASAADVNGDGNMDLISGSVVLLSNGENLASAMPWTGSGEDMELWMDRNGDGVVDYVTSRMGGFAGEYRPGLGKKTNYLLSAKDGFEKKVVFDYAPLTDSAVYTRGSGSTGRTRDLQAPMYVVKTMTLSDGIGGSYTQSYTYGGAKRNIRGRGFLGFATREITDSRTKFVTREVYNNTVAADGSLWEYVGTLASRTTYQYKNGGSYGPKVEELTQTWSAVLVDWTSNRRYPYISVAEVKRYELTGTNSPYSTITKTTNVDNYGNPYNVVTTTVEGITGLNPGSSSTVRVYMPPVYILNDTANWCIARPQQIEETRSHTLNATDGAAITRVSTQNWDPSQCRVTHKTVAPGSGYQLDSDIEYDSFNNVKKLTVTGNNVGAAPIVTEWNYGGNGHLLQWTKNAKNQTTYFGWSIRLAFKTSETDPNGLVTTWVPDDFGREKEMIRPDQTRTFKRYFNCTWANFNCGDGLLRYVVRTEERNTANDDDNLINYTDQFFDVLGRVKYEQSRSFDGSQTLVTETMYDDRGNVALKTNPHYAGSGSVSGVSMSYDSLNRLIETQRRVSDTDRTVIGEHVVYEGLKTRSFDANGHEASKIANVIGTISRATDEAGKSTVYAYNGFGELLSTTDPSGNVSSIHRIAARGFKDYSDDPDMGHWSYTYDALGQMLTQTDAKNQTTTFTYEALGRVATRIDHGGGAGNTTTFTYDTAASGYGIGQLAGVTSPGGYSESFSYDNKGRRQQMTTVAADTSFVVDYSYEPNIGKLDTITYPSSTGTRLTVKYGYQNGFVKDVRNLATNGVIWQANGQDARGHVTQEQYGNGQVTNLGFDQTNGRLYTIQTGTAGATATQNLVYTWDFVGNLSARRDNNQNITEGFVYDALNRVTSIQRESGALTTMAYDDIGNITNKSNVGSYTYTGAQSGCNYTGLTSQPHAVRAVTNNTYYCYDANGNMVSRWGATVTWSTYNYPTTITQWGGNTSTFYYGADRNRYRQVSVDGGVTEDRITVAGGAFEKLTRGSVTEYRHFVQIAGKAVAIIKRSTQAGNDDTFYLHEDHLGSTDVITNAAGTVVVRASFDAWGQRRGSNWSGVPSAADKIAFAGTTHLGFTGHEQLDGLNLVHMGGRVYDPVIGRFMSADPIIQDPYHSQSFNRYAYVWNNPLNSTDPTGFCMVTGSHIEADKCVDPVTKQELDKKPEVSDNGHDRGTTARSNSPATATTQADARGLPAQDAGLLDRERSKRAEQQDSQPQSDSEAIQVPEPFFGPDGRLYYVDPKQMQTAKDDIRRFIPAQAKEADPKGTEYYGRNYYSDGRVVEGRHVKGFDNNLCYGSAQACNASALRNPVATNRANPLPSRNAAHLTMNVHLHPGVDSNSILFSDSDMSLSNSANIPVFIGNMRGDVAVFPAAMSPNRGVGIILCKGCAK